MTEKPIVQQAEGFSWQRLGMTAVCLFLYFNRISCMLYNQAGVAGTVVVVDALFNRETRDALSPTEKWYLHRSFQYTGGGLAITALAARSIFKSGYAFRIMAANPC